MVAFMFLFAPVVVLIAVLIMQRFLRRRDGNLDDLMARVAESGRREPRFGAGNDNAEHPPGVWLDHQSISTG